MPASNTAPGLDVPLLAGRYSLEERVASGGMGTVYRGLDLDNGTPAAVKVLRNHRDDDVQRFEREATLLASLSHPGIARYLGHGASAAGARFLAAEWIEGETLNRRGARSGFSVACAVSAVAQLAEALAAAHAVGIVHRDIKPHNAIITAADRVVLIDFGIARSDSESGLTETGTVLGTPGYMSPEQASGRRGLSAKSDVFGLGCLLYELLTGRAAFEGCHLMALRTKVLLCEPDPISAHRPDVPPRLERLAFTALAKDADDRPSAAELAAGLRELAESGDLPTEPGASFGHETSTTVLDRGRSKGVAPAPADQPVHSVAVIALTDTDDRTATDLARVARRYRTELRSMADGSVIAVVADRDASALAERTAECGLAMRRVAAVAPMVIAGALDRSEAQIKLLEAAIDIGVSALVEHTLAQLFGAPGNDDSTDSPAAAANAIRVDGGIAALLDDRFHVVPAGDHAVLVP